MRLRKVKYAPMLLSANPRFVVNDPLSFRGRWAQAFPNHNQCLHLEIGCGKGKFITEMAKRHPDLNFIALERFDSVLVRVLEKLIKDPLDNLLLVCADAEQLPSMFSKGEISGLYLNFPDPWPKRRQAKKRLTTTKFLDMYSEIMADKGIIRYKTDDFGFYHYSLLSFNKHPLLCITRQSLDLANSDIDNITTEFEERFQKLGKPIFYLEAVNRRRLP